MIGRLNHVAIAVPSVNIASEKYTKCKDYQLSNYIERKSHFFLDGVLFTFSILDKYKLFFKLMKNQKITEVVDTKKQIKVIIVFF